MILWTLRDARGCSFYHEEVATSQPVVALPATSSRISPEALYRVCDPDALGFETTADVPPADGTVGQERALHAMQFALSIEAEGYNLYVSGPVGTGRNVS